MVQMLSLPGLLNLLLMFVWLSVLMNSVLEWKWVQWRSCWMVHLWSLLLMTELLSVLMNSVLEWK